MNTRRPRVCTAACARPRIAPCASLATLAAILTLLLQPARPAHGAAAEPATGTTRGNASELPAGAARATVTPPPPPPPVARPAYDAELARRLGADERGMKRYALVLLKTGPKTDLPKDEETRAFEGHMANIGRLADAGLLVFAGPLVKNEQRYRGIFVFNVRTPEEAQALVATDPAVRAGLLVGETYGLYGSAALDEIGRIHKSISKE